MSFVYIHNNTKAATALFYLHTYFYLAIPRTTIVRGISYIFIKVVIIWTCALLYIFNHKTNIQSFELFYFIFCVVISRTAYTSHQVVFEVVEIIQFFYDFEFELETLLHESLKLKKILLEIVISPVFIIEFNNLAVNINISSACLLQLPLMRPFRRVQINIHFIQQTYHNFYDGNEYDVRFYRSADIGGGNFCFIKNTQLLDDELGYQFLRHCDTVKI